MRRPAIWWRRWRWPLLVAALAGLVVWNLVFDLWLGQGERQYLWESAKHALGEGRAVSLQGSVSASIAGGLVVATAWTVFVVAAVLGAAWLGYRAGREEGGTADRPDAGAPPQGPSRGASGGH